MEQTRHHVTIKPGTVLVTNADGTYQVLPDSGRSFGQPIDGVRSLIEADLSPGDRVVLIWQRPGEPPWILRTGEDDDDGAFFQAYRDAGFWQPYAD